MNAFGHPNLHVLLDARWLGNGGPGRVTEHLLRGLAVVQPAGRWSVWGPERVSEFLWDGAELVPSRFAPTALHSQREIPGPRHLHADVAFFPHQLRPAWHLGKVEVTIIHDTIPFRFPPNPRLLRAMKLYFRRMAALSTVVATDSEFSRGCLMRDLGLPNDRIDVLRISIDHDSAARLRARRSTAVRLPHALFVGRDGPHKNLDRLVEAFARTQFQRDGGELHLLGIGEAARARLEPLARSAGTRLVVHGVVPQDELDERMATCTLLVQPSLEEGFGLPVAEGLAAGIPVAASAGGSIPEILRGAWPTFDPTNLDAIAAGVDHAADHAASGEPVPDLSWATPVDLATSALDAIDHALCDRRFR